MIMYGIYFLQFVEIGIGECARYSIWNLEDR